MNPRENLLAAMRRQQPEWVPKNAQFTAATYETFKRMTGSDDPYDYFGIDFRYVGFKPTEAISDFTSYLDDSGISGKMRIDEWGVGRVKGSVYHFEDMVHPMTGFAVAEDLDAYPWPDVNAAYRREGIREEVRDIRNKGYAVLGGMPDLGGTVFETCWKLRGLENFLVDMLVNKEFAEALLDRVTGMMVDNAAFLADCGVDMLQLGDDIGSQRALMVSPETYREWLKPRLARIIASARSVNPDILVFYHSDGYIYPVIEDLIETGVDILNPVQPECMDPAAVKREFGDRLSFWGTIGTQTTMPFGTPEDVRSEVKERIETVGSNGGLLIAPTHVLEPDVPWENIEAFFEAVEEYGR